MQSFVVYMVKPSLSVGITPSSPIQKQTITVTPQKLLYSKAMSEVQVAVKWLFGNVGNYCKFVDFKNLFLNFVLFLLFINTLPT